MDWKKKRKPSERGPSNKKRPNFDSPIPQPEPLKPKPSPTINVDRLTLLASFEGWVHIDEEPIPLVEPIIPIVDQMDFDRSVCECGVKKFIRKTHVSDYPSPESRVSGGSKEILEQVRSNHELGEHVMVMELAKGVRAKRSVDLLIHSEQN